jgi:hypothetical protein
MSVQITPRLCVDVEDPASIVRLAQQAGLEPIVRRLTFQHFERLARPVYLLVSADRVPGLDADELRRLRFQFGNGIRYAPVIVTDVKRAEMEAWRGAGAVPVQVGASEKGIRDALAEARDGAEHWVVSGIYIGPCRRRRIAFLKLHARRRDDRAMIKKDALRSEGPIEVGVPPATLLSRLRVASTCIAGAPVEQRTHFLDLARSFAAACRRYGLDDCVADAEALVDEARILAKDSLRDAEEASALILRLSNAA